MRAAASFILALSLSTWFPVQAATALDDSTQRQLVQLEKKYFGHSYDSDSDEARTARLENLVYGAASTGDPAVRVKKLASSSAFDPLTGGIDQNAQAEPTKAAKSQSDGQSDTLDDSDGPGTNSQADSGDQTDYPRINALEQAILGQTYPGQPLPGRISRMEKKAFGSESHDDDLSQRADALEKYAEKKLHKKTVEHQEKRATASSGQPQGSGVPGQLLNVVGNSLLGLAGMGMGLPFVPALGAMRARPNQQAASQQTQQVSSQPEAKSEDPAINASTPPPSTARMLTKVGWCEMQVFGSTFPEMHLPARLGQLNRELRYKPGKSDIELMDEMNGLMQAVQAQKIPTRSIGSSPATKTN